MDIRLSGTLLSLNSRYKTFLFILLIFILIYISGFILLIHTSYSNLELLDEILSILPKFPSFLAFDKLSHNPTQTKMILLYFLLGYFYFIPFVLFDYLINRKDFISRISSIKDVFLVLILFLFYCSLIIIYIFYTNPSNTITSALFNGGFISITSMFLSVFMPLILSTLLFQFFDGLLITIRFQKFNSKNSHS